ncbi:MAG: glutathione S-transferase C-terminal domain-containing protein [Gloeocapsa sp. UFS-A4-WI-NPMV-4B04]|jgi:glutathione S-transferase|nr:glutathione S-transferase C-terminal domain-containing protein [Gloeocapsa sp. UFS-A4-WI-NPMV-4B04]
MQWLSIAANEIQNSLAAARKYFLLNAKIDLESAQKRTHEILQIMTEHLAKQQWLGCDRPTIADIACFPDIGIAAKFL